MPCQRSCLASVFLWASFLVEKPHDSQQAMEEINESLQQATEHLCWCAMAIVRVEHNLAQLKGQGKGGQHQEQTEGAGKGDGNGDGKGYGKGDGKGYGKASSSRPDLRGQFPYGAPACPQRSVPQTPPGTVTMTPNTPVGDSVRPPTAPDLPPLP